MYTIEQIRTNIVPVPQKVTAAKGGTLKLAPGSKIALTCPQAEKGPIKTAGEKIAAFLTDKCGEDCFASDGIPVVLELGTAPAEVKNEKEGYRITINAEGITITGFGDSGLFYGVISFTQLCKWDCKGIIIPAVEILDWPDNHFRCYKEECRYGSNLMEKADWFEMIDDLASKKMNYLSLGLYCCWKVQYDGRVQESLYYPIPDHPEINTPVTVKYYSPTEGKWYNYEQLPPIYRDNFLGDVIRYAKDRGMDTIPGINSYGHNTLIPRMLPDLAPKAADGTPQPTGFCTSNPDTYKFLFSIYDDLIDNYLIPNEIYSFNILLDEVRDECGIHSEHKEITYSPYCQCEQCRGSERHELYIEHAVKLIKYLKNKGMKTILMAGDMVARGSSKLGNKANQLMQRLKEEDLLDVLLFGWWWYHDRKEQLDFLADPDEVGLRSSFNPWNGYFIWSMLTSPLPNNQILAEINHNSKCGEGMGQYSMWDRSYDRVHDCFADYVWNYEGTGSVDDVTRRYVQRHFAPMEEEAYRAYRLMDWITEERKTIKNKDDTLATVLSNFNILVLQLSYYNYTYYRGPEFGDYPRHVPGEGMQLILGHRFDYERLFYSVSAMAREAVAIFEKAAKTPGCDQTMAERMVYECSNYQVIVEDWMGFLEIYDLSNSGNYEKLVQVARARQAARTSLMSLCERTKEEWVVRAATMRNHSVIMQCFADIADYVESTDKPELNIFDIRPIMSAENWMLR